MYKTSDHEIFITLMAMGHEVQDIEIVNGKMLIYSFDREEVEESLRKIRNRVPIILNIWSVYAAQSSFKTAMNTLK